LLDGHSSHLFNLEFLDKCKGNNVEVVALPPHTTHITQPLDDVPFASFRTLWNGKLEDLNIELCGAKITKKEILENILPIFNLAFSVTKVKAGFMKCGIYPVNPDVAKIRKLARSSGNIPRPSK